MGLFDPVAVPELVETADVALRSVSGKNGQEPAPFLLRDDTTVGDESKILISASLNKRMFLNCSFIRHDFVENRQIFKISKHLHIVRHCSLTLLDFAGQASIAVFQPDHRSVAGFLR